MPLLYLLVSMFTAYLMGSIPTSLIIARSIKGIDIREHGSGNIGATNLMRVMGKGPGGVALALDILKGMLPVVVLQRFFYTDGLHISLALFNVLMGLCAVCGHIWTIFLRFKGGKGVATTIGVFIGLSPLVTAIGLIFWLITVMIFRYVSVGSVVMAISLPLLMAIFSQPAEYIMLSILLCLFIVYRHRPNIRRLMEGAEFKIGQRSEKR